MVGHRRRGKLKMRLHLLIALSLIMVTGAISMPDASARHHKHHQKKSWKKYRKYNWNQERNFYRQRWNRINASQRSRYDSQMRAQWLAYHNNNWNGSYNWNNYNDPGFLDYLHTRSPGLLTNIRSILGF